MDCLKFTHWLENRDTYDISEMDKAMKHADRCEQCTVRLQFDEQLEKQLFKAMEEVEMPRSLVDKVDLSLDRISATPSKKRYGVYGTFSALIAASIAFFLLFPFSPVIPSMDELGRYVIEDHGHHDDSVLVVNKVDELQNLGDIKMSYTDIQGELPDHYRFVGARMCPLGECEAVHLVYLAKGRRVSVYMIKNSDISFSLSTGKHYTMTSGEETVSFWKKGGYLFAMIG